jgi:WG containing repeat
MQLKIFLFFTFACTSIFGQNQKLYKFSNKSGLYGFIDKTGKIRINPTFKYVQDFSESLAFVSKETSKRGYKWICIDTLGNEVFDIEDNLIEKEFSEGFAVVSNFNEKWFVNNKGKKVFNKTWKSIGKNFKNEIAEVSDSPFGGNDYNINIKGEKLDNSPKNNGYSIVFDKTKSIIDSLGNKVFEDFESFGGFNDELIKIEKNGKWGFIDKKGNIIIDFLYEEDRRKEFDKFRKLNIDSLESLPKSKLRNIGFFYCGLVEFQQDSLWGFLNKKNEIIVKPQFKKVRRFSEGFAGVSFDGIKWGIIDTNSKFIIEPKFHLIRYFERGICAVLLNPRPFKLLYGSYYDAIINLKGEIINELPLNCFMGFKGDLIEYYDGYHFTGGVHYLNELGEKVEPKE